MKLKRLLSVLDVCACTADPELDIRDISFDSRTTQPGDLFAAVCGYESDGHRFIGAAVERGAAVVLCQKKPEVDIPYILVADSRLALSRICCEFFDNPSRELTMIGVTGTNGKTTVTTLIKHMLEQCLHTKVGLIGTNANIIGDEALHTEHTTPDAYELQKLLRRMPAARTRSWRCRPTRWCCTVWRAFASGLAFSRTCRRIIWTSIRPWRPTPRPRRCCSRRAMSASSTPMTSGRTS